MQAFRFLSGHPLLGQIDKEAGLVSELIIHQASQGFTISSFHVLICEKLSVNGDAISVVQTCCCAYMVCLVVST